MASKSRRYISFVVDWVDMKPNLLLEFMWELLNLTCTSLYFSKEQNYANITSYIDDFTHIEKKYGVVCHRGQVPTSDLVQEFLNKKRRKKI